MTSQNLTIASQNEASPRQASRDLVMSGTLTKVVDLLAVIKDSRPDQPHSMLTTAATHFANYMGVPLPDLTTSTLRPAMQGFGPYLGKLRSKKGKPLERNSVRSYTNFVQLLLRLGEELGWSAEPSKAEAKWKEILSGIKLPRGFGGIVKYANANGLLPSRFSDDHLKVFKQLKTANGRHPQNTQKLLGQFRHVIVANDLRDEFPLITHPLDGRFFGINPDNWPEPCRTQVRELIASRLNPATRRLQRGSRRGAGKSSRRENENIRPSTARNVKTVFGEALGYGVQKHGLDLRGPIDIFEVVCPPIIDPFISWKLDERKVAPNGIYNSLAQLRGSLQKCPTYQSIDFDWMTDLMNTIPVEDEEAAIDRKSKHFIEHRLLCEIPLKIEKERSHTQRGTIEYARLTHDILLSHWMPVFAWRQFNVRTCSLGTSKHCPNILKAGFDAYRTIGKPDEVEAELARNPGAEFWQIFFPKEQVKTKQVIRGIVPLYLVPLLEDYITNQRPLLVNAVDSGTLFLNQQGKPYSNQTFGYLIGGLTQKHTGRWGHPHLYRDALAYRWLDSFPEDYLSLSKHLWHRDINTTIRRYGRNFDESHGLKKVGGWVGTLYTH